jgi:ribosome hibernation promoting factor
MQVSVTGKQVDVGEALRSHVEQRLTDAVSKYFDQAIEASAVMSREAHEFRADISVHVGRGILVQGHSHGDNAYAAFDTAMDRIAKRLRRYKRRLRDHHRKVKSAAPEDLVVAQQYVLSEPVEVETRDSGETEASPPIVVAEMTTQIDTLTVEEAVMRMELADQPAVMFHNSAHGGLNVVYRRTDGNFGWIDPQGNSQSRGNN